MLLSTGLHLLRKILDRRLHLVAIDDQKIVDELRMLLSEGPQQLALVVDLLAGLLEDLGPGRVPKAPEG